MINQKSYNKDIIMSKDNQEKNKSLSDLEKKLQGILSDIDTIKKNDGNFEDVINNNKNLEKELKEKTQAYEKLQEQFQTAKQKISEMEQEKMFYEKYSKLSEDEKEKAKQEFGEIKEKYDKEHQQILESEQEKMFLEKSLEVEEKQKLAANKKYYKAIIFSVVAIAVIAGAYSIAPKIITNQKIYSCNIIYF
jgi:predicted nuclease with TOPRIM domain